MKKIQNKREAKKCNAMGAVHSGQKGKKSRIGFCGSFTIEAAYLLPFLFFFIWSVLFLAFFLYDQSVMLQGSYCTALRTERLLCDTEERAYQAEEKYRQAVEGRLVYGERQHEIAIEENGITVESELTMQAPTGRLFWGLWQGKQRQQAEKWEPVAFIRKCRKAEKLLNRKAA